MSASGLASLGTTFAVDGTTIAQVYTISGPGLSKDTPETTDLSDSWRTFSHSGMRDGGEMSFGIRFAPSAATHNGSSGVIAFVEGASAVKSCVITWPDGTTFTFSGIFTGFEPAADIDSALDANVTVKVTGTPTIA